jgi:GNAT superfamily N-acetyltransferase
MRSELEAVTVFRPMVPDDVPFIKDSWLKSFRDSPWAGCVSNNMYTEVYNDTVEQLWGRGAEVWVACAAHDHAKILGWICVEAVPGGRATHYLYIKDPYRRKGLASSLLEKFGGRFYTFRTRSAQYFKLQHAPEIARRK